MIRRKPTIAAAHNRKARRETPHDFARKLAISPHQAPQFTLVEPAQD
jgi:hypothetical protein